jgi:multidrug resistance efflux pump
MWTDRQADGQNDGQAGLVGGQMDGRMVFNLLSHQDALRRCEALQRDIAFARAEAEEARGKLQAARMSETEAAAKLEAELWEARGDVETLLEQKDALQAELGQARPAR